ncbi:MULTISPECIES: hypothetical protein [Bradyrhizobium]|nr:MULTISPECIES: hypothetical protein [Bradyrhizobium]
MTALIEGPGRLVYLSSGMHHHAGSNLDDVPLRIELRARSITAG